MIPCRCAGFSKGIANRPAATRPPPTEQPPSAAAVPGALLHCLDGAGRDYRQGVRDEGGWSAGKQATQKEIPNKTTNIKQQEKGGRQGQCRANAGCCNRRGRPASPKRATPAPPELHRGPRHAQLRGFPTTSSQSAALGSQARPARPPPARRAQVVRSAANYTEAARDELTLLKQVRKRGRHTLWCWVLFCCCCCCTVSRRPLAL